MHPSLRILVMGSLLVAAVSGCAKNPSTTPLGTMSVRMTDAPADLEAVNLMITEVAAHRGDATSDSTSGWEILSSHPTNYDLLELRNGVFTEIGLAKIPAGHYTQIRLKLGVGCSMVVEGTTYPLTVPSGLQTGYKLVGSFDVPANGLLDLALDFDAARSITTAPTGGYLLKPTVRVMPFSTAGAIDGQIQPAGVPATVFALLGTDTVGSAMPDVDGRFQMSVLPAGTYAVAFAPDSGYRDSTLTGVVVNAGATTSLGTVELTPQ